MFAFKEWALVCNALGRGEQSIILRKGGIAEGSDGFRFQHDEFFLFPTLFHEQVAKLKLPPETPVPAMPMGEVRLDLFARVEWTQVITDLDVARRLAPFHIWRGEVVEERFHYGGKNELHLAFVRVYRATPEWKFPDSPEYGGCRSWVTIPDPPANAVLSPVLSDSESITRSQTLREFVGSV